MTSPEGSFATGASMYFDSQPGRKEPDARIYVQFRPAGAPLDYLALLDTGGHFCVLSKDVVFAVSGKLTHSLGQTNLLTAYGRVQGELYKSPIELIAEEGEKLIIEATVFVSPEWHGPTFIGYTGVWIIYALLSTR